MSKIFDLDSPAMRFLTTASELVLLNLLTVLCSLPVFTVGAAQCGLYYAVRHLQQDEGAPIKDFFEGFRGNFRQATVLWLLEIVSFVVIAGALWLYMGQTQIVTAIRVAGLLLMGIAVALWILSFSWLVPLQVSFKNTVFRTVGNALRCGCANLLPSISMAVLNLIPLLCWLFRPEWFWMLAVLWMAVWFAFTAFLNMKAAGKVFAAIS